MSIELIPVFLYLGGKMETWQIVLVLVGVLLAILFAVGVAKWAIMWSLGMTDLIEVLLRIEEKLENISRKSSRQDSSNVDFILNSIGEDANTNHGLLQDVLTNIQKKLDDIAMNTKKQKQQGE